MFIYKILLTLESKTGESDPILRRRSLESLEVLSQELQAHFPYLPEVALLAELVDVRSSRKPPDALALQRVLQLCISNRDVVHSACLSQFLWDIEDETKPDSGDNDQPDGGMHCALDFILEPVEMVAHYIPCRQIFSQDYFIQKGQTILWRLTVGGGYDIELSVLFRQLGVGVDPAQDASAFGVIEAVSIDIYCVLCKTIVLWLASPNMC